MDRLGVGKGLCGLTFYPGCGGCGEHEREANKLEDGAWEGLLGGVHLIPLHMKQGY